MIDTMLVQYYWTRTGYFTLETFAVWLTLEFLAIAGSLIFVHSFGQSLQPLQMAIHEPAVLLEQNYDKLKPQSSDELGVLARKYRDLLRSLHEQHMSMEQTVEERTQELEAANRELESFSYSVSHDLRAPLRTINGFSNALLEDYAGNLDETGKDYLHRMQAATHRMSQLIEDMLLLSNVTRQELRAKPVNLTTLAEDVASQLSASNPDRTVDVNIARDLQTLGDQRLLKILLENLLGNAFKYTGHITDAKIEVGFDNQKQAFYVKDNGAGFDMHYANKLFTPFQRLHSQEEFEGSGIGLATASRILHRHKGKIWAESKVGEGSTFYFRLPLTIHKPVSKPSRYATQ
jgi:light-regulated signal transduction histidine kinase (bacteriophytochrome)